MTETGDERKDLPRIIGAVGVHIPGLVFRLGITYLKLKRNSNRASKQFTSRLEREGVPPELAKSLGEAYGSELSIRKVLSGKGISIVKNIKQW
ncbi:MAG: hypothetical protein IH630_00340 [Thermoplasmata archaeon]|nr:hypothetical protein [Thermoplasmata archaeon]MBU1158577.1 hypothetical protein [Candidatus Thermoplasmatota archaeon]MCJ7561832.1 hypothetical protein [Thermoplasmata archaeon]